MAVKIRLKRLGKIRAPYYRVVVMDSRAKRDGRAIEEIGKYHPTQEPSLIQIDTERAQYWLGVGAQPTEQVAALLKITGDWQKFKGEPGAEGTLKVAEPKADKKALFDAASRSAADEPKDGATTPRKKKADKAEPKADAKAEAKVEEPAEPKVEAEAEAKTEEPAEAPAATDGGFGPDSAAPLEDGSAPEGFTVKGNKDSMKFHTTDSQWYDKTAAEVWFRTAEAAAAAGFVAPGGDKTDEKA